VAALTPEQLLDERLGRIRTAITAYKLEHNFQPPTFLWSDLTDTSYGGFGGGGGGGITRTLGPYMAGPVVNPLTKSSNVAMWGFGTDRDGWEYDSLKGQVRPVRPGQRPGP
jgi:hypothetical protein